MFFFLAVRQPCWLRSFLVHPVRIPVSHHLVHALDAVNSLLAHVRTLSDVQAAESASLLQENPYGEQQYTYCTNSQSEEG